MRRPDMVEIEPGVTTAALFQGGAAGACRGETPYDGEDMRRYLAATGASIAFAGFSAANAKRGQTDIEMVYESRGEGRVAVRILPGQQVLTADQRRAKAQHHRSAYESTVAVGRALMLAEKLAPNRNATGPKFGHIPLAQFAQATAFLWETER